MKPILFNTEMVQAILQGRKTVTRRLVKPQPEKCGGAPICCGPEEICRESNSGNWYCAHCGNNFVGMKAPYQPGDILWVRETWCERWGDCSKLGRYIYRAHAEPQDEIHQYALDQNTWRPSIHMPREAARIFLRVTDVRVERLQEITEAEAEKEGFTITVDEAGWGTYARMNFAELWESTVKPNDLPRYGYEANPWVWLIEFERYERGVIND